MPSCSGVDGLQLLRRDIQTSDWQKKRQHDLEVRSSFSPCACFAFFLNVAIEKIREGNKTTGEANDAKCSNPPRAVHLSSRAAMPESPLACASFYTIESLQLSPARLGAQSTRTNTESLAVLFPVLRVSGSLSASAEWRSVYSAKWFAIPRLLVRV